MTRAALLLPILLVAALLPATAHAKEISKVSVCGASGCLDVTDRDRIAAVIDYGPPAGPPEAKAPFGARGVWISGAPHAVMYADRNGQFRDDRLALAGDTLLWERDGLVLRIEGATSRAQALKIARSMR